MSDRKYAKGGRIEDPGPMDDAVLAKIGECSYLTSSQLARRGANLLQVINEGKDSVDDE